MPPIVIATATGVRSVDQAKIRAAQSLGASPMQIIKHVVLPSSLPSILTGIRIGLWGWDGRLWWQQSWLELLKV